MVTSLSISSQNLLGLLRGKIESFGQIHQRPARSIPKAHHCLSKHTHQHVQPGIGLGLGYPKHCSLSLLQRVELEVDQHEKQPILRCGQGTVSVCGVCPPGAGLAIKAPSSHMGEKGFLERFHQSPEVFQAQARQGQQSRWLVLNIGES